MFDLREFHLVRPSVGRRGLMAGAGAVALIGALVGVAAGVSGSPHSATQPGVYVPLTPNRILDTRSGIGAPPYGPVMARVPRTFKVTNQSLNPGLNVPSTAIAVTGNLTATETQASGFLSLGPVPIAFPTTSTQNFLAGQTIANGVTVALGTNGTLSVTYGAIAGKTAQVLFDVTGYYLPDDDSVALGYRAGQSVTGTDGTVAVVFSALSGLYSVSLTGEGSPVIAYVTNETSIGFTIHVVDSAGDPVAGVNVDWTASLRSA